MATTDAVMVDCVNQFSMISSVTILFSTYGKYVARTDEIHDVAAVTQLF
jgi:hypothetical protein